MEASVRETKTGNSVDTSQGTPMPQSVKRKQEPRIADGDRIVLVVVAELKALGYQIDPVNFEDEHGNLTAGLVLAGKVWSDTGSLEKQKEKKS